MSQRKLIFLILVLFAAGLFATVKGLTITPTDVSKGKPESITLNERTDLVPVTEISITNARPILIKGTSSTLNMTVLPNNATDKSVIWASSNPEVATVDQKGHVTAVASGNATITATTNDGSGKYGSCKITVGTEFDEFVELTIQYAEKQPQYPVDKKGATKYGTLFKQSKSAWCTEFVMWCLKQAENDLGTSHIRTAYPWSDYSGECVSWFQAKSRLHYRSSDYTPQRGDLIFFNYGTGGSTDHTGLVLGTEVSEGVTYVLTIEGNIPTDKVKQIRKRRLPLTDRNIVCYGACRK